MSIAAYIEEDLTARLLLGRELPVQLTLDSLAEHYRVSYTPVRSAVAELIQKGLLEKKPNGRLAANPSSSKVGKRGRPKLPEPPPDSFELVANDLVQLSFGAQPIYLREEATAEKYGLSRSVIRNILHRLAGEGMLDHIPRRGWRLRPFQLNDLQAFTEVREVLELKALRLARGKLDPQVLQRILEANSLPKSADVPPQVDESLHEYLIATSGNAYIRDFFERQGRYHRLLYQWEDNDRATAIETVCQHREILKALLKKNWSAARKALSRHIRNNHSILSQVGKRSKLVNGKSIKKGRQ